MNLLYLNIGLNGIVPRSIKDSVYDYVIRQVKIVVDAVTYSATSKYTIDFGLAIGEWNNGAEPTLVVRMFHEGIIEKADIECICESLCIALDQDAVAYTYDGEVYMEDLVYRENYTGMKVPFGIQYFKTFRDCNQ